MEFFLFLTLKIYSSSLKRGPGSWRALQGTTWKVDKNNTPGLRTQSLSGPHGEEGEWAVSFDYVPRLWSEDCREAPDEWDAKLHLLPFVPGPSHAAGPATAVTDGKQMSNFAGSERSETGNRGCRHPFSFVPPQKQFEEGKLYPRNDPARGLNYSRLKPIPCFKDLCNLKWKKKKK